MAKISITIYRGFPALQAELDSNEDEIYRRLEEVENQ